MGWYVQTPKPEAKKVSGGASTPTDFPSPPVMAGSGQIDVVASPTMPAVYTATPFDLYSVDDERNLKIDDIRHFDCGSYSTILCLYDGSVYLCGRGYLGSDEYFWNSGGYRKLNFDKKVKRVHASRSYVCFDLTGAAGQIAETYLVITEDDELYGFGMSYCGMLNNAPSTTEVPDLTEIALVVAPNLIEIDVKDARIVGHATMILKKNGDLYFVGMDSFYMCGGSDGQIPVEPLKSGFVVANPATGYPYAALRPVKISDRKWRAIGGVAAISFNMPIALDPSSRDLCRFAYPVDSYMIAIEDGTGDVYSWIGEREDLPRAVYPKVIPDEIDNPKITYTVKVPSGAIPFPAPERLEGALGGGWKNLYTSIRPCAIDKRHPESSHMAAIVLLGENGRYATAYPNQINSGSWEIWKHVEAENGVVTSTRVRQRTQHYYLSSMALILTDGIKEGLVNAITGSHCAQYLGDQSDAGPTRFVYEGGKIIDIILTLAFTQPAYQGIDTNGLLWGWGNNLTGAAGIGAQLVAQGKSETGDSSVPLQILTTPGYAKLAGGSMHALAWKPTTAQETGGTP